MRPSPWWPALAWAAAIFVGTSIPGSELARLPTGGDKVVHVALYAPLGLLAARALRRTGATRGGVVATLVGLALFAALDELHQIWVPGRSADRLDWLADVIGGATGFFALLIPTPRSEPRL